MRLFVAIELEESQRRFAAACARRLQEAFGPLARRVRWVAADHLHFTLKFLGEVPDRRVDAARRGARAAEQVEPFSVTLGAIGAFPSPARPRIFWIGVTAGEQSLVALARVVDAALTAEGFVPEARPYVPHVTIGRVRQDHEIPRHLGSWSEVNATNSVPLHVHSVVLMESVLGAAGPTYRTISTVTLGGGRAIDAGADAQMEFGLDARR